MLGLIELVANSILGTLGTVTDAKILVLCNL